MADPNRALFESVVRLLAPVDLGTLGINTVSTFTEMGIAPPLTFPDDLADPPELDEGANEDALNRYYAAIDEHPITSTVRNIYASLAGVSAF